jgi:LPXTG-motif cell wall-anchored protein
MVDQAATTTTTPTNPIVNTDPDTYNFTFSKQDIGGNELKGATIELKDDEGNLIEKWTSNGSTHQFTVEPGKYFLEETAAPSGYEIATVIEVTVGENGSIQKDGTTVSGTAPIVMVDDYADQTFKFSKQDVAGAELKGATITLQNSEGTTVETWVSDGSVHEFSVKPGTYTLVETAAPRGYEVATSITVTVKSDGSIKKDGVAVSGTAPIVMVDSYADQTFKFSKEDAEGAELKGATIKLQKEDGTTIETWVSDGTVHEFTVKPGTYKLVETAAPDGYTIATTIEVTIKADGTIQKDGVSVSGSAPIVMVDDLDTDNTPSQIDDPKDDPKDDPTDEPSDVSEKDEPTPATQKEVIAKFNNSDKNLETLPKTGDSFNPVVPGVAGAVALLAIAGVFVATRRRRDHEK